MASSFLWFGNPIGFFGLGWGVLVLRCCWRVFSSFVESSGYSLSSNSQAQYMVHRLSCSAACGIFLDQGSNPCPLHWQVDSYSLYHQGSPSNLSELYKTVLGFDLLSKIFKPMVVQVS